MNIDLCTDLLARDLLAILDPKQAGSFIEIGLGTVNYSFEWAAPAGFRCLAVEPLPSEHLETACRARGVTLVTAAVSDHRGTLPIYLGKLDGHGLSDISSLNPRWWGSSTETRLVDALTLQDLFEAQKIGRVALLKVDTEGSEAAVLQGLATLGAEQIPELVIFEYGGGGKRSRGGGGWAGEFFSSTLHCMEILRSAGFSRGFLIESSQREALFFEAALVSPSDLFPLDAEVGNLLFVRGEFSPQSAREMIERHRGPLAESDRHAKALARRQIIAHYRTRFAAGLRRRVPWFKILG